MICVVGGGLAGLAAAYGLRRRGHDVRVVERRRTVGGLARPVRTRGEPVERLPIAFDPDAGPVRSLAETLGLEDRLDATTGRRGVYLEPDGVVHPVDAPWEVLSYPPLSLRDAWRLAGVRRATTVDEEGRVRVRGEAVERFDDRTARAFARERATSAVYDSLWRPSLATRFGDRADDVSAAWLLARLARDRDRSGRRGSRYGTVRGSASVLVDALVEAIGPDRIRTGARVSGIDVDDGSVAGVTLAGAGRNRDRDHLGDSGGGPDDTVALADDTAVSADDTAVSADDTAPLADDPDDLATAGDGGVGVDRLAVDGLVVADDHGSLLDRAGIEPGLDVRDVVVAAIGTGRPLLEGDVHRVAFGGDAPFEALLSRTALVPPDRYGGDHWYHLVGAAEPGEVVSGRSIAGVERRWLEALSDRFPAFDVDDLLRVETTCYPAFRPVYEPGSMERLLPAAAGGTGASVPDGIFYAGRGARARFARRWADGAVAAGLACADALADR